MTAKRIAPMFLQAIVVLIGTATLAFLIVAPRFEGRNVDATLFEIYFTDPFLAYAYIASIPVFMVLAQAFKVLGYIKQNKVFSSMTTNALRTMKRCALAMIVFVAGGEAFIFLDGAEEIPPAVAMGLLITLGALVIAAAATTGEEVVRNGASAQNKQ